MNELGLWLLAQEEWRLQRDWRHTCIFARQRVSGDKTPIHFTFPLTHTRTDCGTVLRAANKEFTWLYYPLPDLIPDVRKILLNKVCELRWIRKCPKCAFRYKHYTQENGYTHRTQPSLYDHPHGYFTCVYMAVHITHNDPPKWLSGW